MLDQDAAAVIDRLDRALTTSGLSLRQFARALGTSPSRFVAYRSGRTAPSAAFLLRAERIGDALGRAREQHVPSSIEAAAALRRATKRGDDDWTWAIALEVRDRLRDVLEHRRDLAAAWEAQPPAVDDHWDALIAAFVDHEFSQAGLPAPKWTARHSLEQPWVLDTPRLTDDQVRAQTPEWLAERNIFVATKDLVTA
ncbi:helix-turn-helix domain-containing protein [Nocardioides flavescens]|uniref:XRE family transcriptional regulator n=1 Tax=Nocardioides flavescens TaxID=2691959 RepID=A0A6L7F4G0_9ACTN|nr:helix-turn-helix transcriptional regulator [Nocardioides flavescens]MXG92076.1 XRE family transcriptional regulator [Nocardioides flavescens]